MTIIRQKIDEGLLRTSDKSKSIHTEIPDLFSFHVILARPESFFSERFQASWNDIFSDVKQKEKLFENELCDGKILNTGGITNMKIAYLDCFSGISGDMCLGALVDAGVSLKKLLGELEKMPLKGYEIRVRKVKRAGITATKADVILKAEGKEQRAKRWEDIEKIIHKSSLSKKTREKGLKVFERLFKAEAKIHGATVE